LTDFVTCVPASCVAETNIVWGNNFVVDDDLVAVVAGIYGMIQPSSWSNYEFYRFIQNSVPAALFALGSIEMMPSQMIVIAPEINAIYFTFMGLPILLVVGLVTLYFCVQDKGADVPTTTYHMLMWGKEHHKNENIPRRHGEVFPSNANNRLVYCRTKEADGRMKIDLKTCRDPFRWFEDPLLYHVVGKQLQDMTDEERSKWIDERMTMGLHQQQVPLSTDNEDVKVLDTSFTRMVDRRLEFLDASERLAWMGVVAGGVNESMPKEKPGTVAQVCDREHSQTSYTLDDGIDGDTQDTKSVGRITTVIEGRQCTDKRAVIRDTKEKCAMCSFYRSNQSTDGTNFIRKRSKMGCPGCDIVLCEHHWLQFDHNPTKYQVQTDAPAATEGQVTMGCEMEV
jgi:hypothetical protein